MTDRQQRMLDEILDNENSRLSGNAMDFIEKLDGDRDLELTDAQASWLEDLWEKASG